ncbi:hypothetical protein [Xenorhabdus sp. PB30.3]|uniref:hypothetical protein n=1 Tax=Xenorhabdus sp. PB30.3 TaxID=2788941 RepID=UPI001E55BAD4|nr:hypothetical protein [Xenorhabdus sp. PB30.3]MCC8382086.1 hypothetical protein [Xenorhabdus sp. PB30.3]
MLIITKNMFSGRDNPCWNIPDPLAIAILKDISTNKKALNYIPRPSISGLRGVIVEIMNPLVAKKFELPTMFRVDDGYAEDVSDSKNLAEMLLNIAIQFESENNITCTKNNFKYAPCRKTDGSVFEYTSCRLRRDTQSNEMHEFDFDNRCKVQAGLYNHSYWLRNGGVNNCYAYACNIRIDELNGFNSRNWPHPGYCHASKVPSNDSELLEGVKHDGIILYTKGTECPIGSIHEPVWLTVLFSGHVGTEKNWDYHWYRRIWAKYLNSYVWGHKMGSDPITAVESEDIQEHARNLGYTNYHGEFLIPKITICANNQIR